MPIRKKYRDTKYSVDTDGNVYDKNDKILKPRIRGSYLCVRIHNGDITKGNTSIHKMIAETFLGQCPKGYVVNHKDGNKSNNKVSNLEYITRSENQKHAYKIGLQKGKRKKRNEYPLGCINLYKTLGYTANQCKKIFNDIPHTMMYRIHKSI